MNKKTLRHFYCRDLLWQCFERMSEDQDRGLDDLVNEAMRVFAREKGYLPAETDARAAAPAPAARPGVPSRPPPPPMPAPHRPTPAHGRPGGPPPAAPPMEMPAPSPAEAPAPPLYLVFQNQRYLVDKDQFIIGRGAKSSDLAIRDGNISRKHAAVIRRNGAYYIKDLGSTNGIDFNGTRIDNKRIEEGDVYSLCDYQISFTYR